MLKHCPFCGGVELVDGDKQGTIFCSSCYAWGPNNQRGNWNNRAEPKREEMPRVCARCRFYLFGEDNTASNIVSLCTHELSVDYVTGYPTKCLDARQSENRCGHAARWFMPKV